MTADTRVLHLIAELGGGGSERWLRDVVRLSPSRFEHRVQTIYSSRLMDARYADDLQDLGAYEPAGGVRLRAETMRRLHTAWSGAPQGLRAAGRIAAGLGAVRPTLAAVDHFRPDVIHSHTLLDFVVGLVVARRKGIPLIHTVPCLFSQMATDGYGWIPQLYSRFHPWVARFSAGDNRDELTRVGVPVAKILYDLGGVDLEAVNAAQARRGAHGAEIRRSLGLPLGCRLALAVGRLHSSKGHVAGLGVVREMLRWVPDLHLVILGDGPERVSLEAAAARMGLADRVHFEGFRSAPLPYYAACDVYFRTSRFEMENLSLYAAMASGLPVVGFDTKQGRDLVAVVGCGLQVPADDTAAFARATAHLLRMDDRGRSWGDRGRVYAAEHLDIKTSVSLLAQAYRELAGGGGS